MGRQASDVVIVGGGVIGLSTAWRLAQAGRTVTVLDRAQIGSEASWAGAGILPPGNPEYSTTPEQRLRALSASLWEPQSRQLREETGIDNGYLNCGGLDVSFSQSLDDDIAKWTEEGVTAERVNASQLTEHFGLNRETVDAFRLPRLAQVRNPRHLKALGAACIAAGVTIEEGTPVHGWERNDEKVSAAKTPRGDISGGQFLLASGAWSGGLAETFGLRLPVKPIRGQIVQLFARKLPFRCVIQEGPRYLVPRPDGRILVGSTEEDVGFEKRNTASAVADLIQFATRLVPPLAEATLERTWSGLRPGSPDGLPSLGVVPETENLYIAAGHFRSGLQMSPGTAQIMLELMTGQDPSIPLDGLHLNRSAQHIVSSASR